MNKSILEVVHETALGLHEAGAMKQKTLREIESLCLPPVKKYSANQIKLISRFKFFYRKNLNLEFKKRSESVCVCSVFKCQPIHCAEVGIRAKET